MRFLLFLVLSINLFLLSSCKKYVPADAAFFLKPGLVSVTTNSLQGSGSNKISDLWLYVNGKFQGVYPNGNVLPIITKNQQVKINIFAGIKNNGISGTRTTWVFYDYLTIDTLVTSGTTINRPLTFHYFPYVVFSWIENFKPPGYSLVKCNDGVNRSDTTWKPAAPADCYEDSSGELGLDANGTVAIVESSITYTLPTGNSNVYLELNYKGNEGFEVGVKSGTTLKSTLFVNPSSTWNKIYISLADAVNREPVTSAQKIYFKLAKTASNPNPKIFLDNIKLVHL